MSDYDTDILVWSERQGELLRRLAANQPVNEAPDWPNIIDEVESVGRSQTDAVQSLLFQALVHRLKAAAWPNSLAAPAGRAEARGFLLQARRRFTPSMRQKLDIVGLYADALRAMPEAIDGQPPQPVPETGTLTLDELLAAG